MGLGRREFIRLVTSAVAGFTLAPGEAVAVCNDLYVNRHFGIAFTKPKGWFFGDIKEMGRVKDGQVLAVDDPDVSELIRDIVGLPIVSVAIDQISGDATRFRPGFHVFVDPADGCDFPLMHAATDPIANRKILREFQVLEEPRNCVVSDCPAAKYTSSFLFEHEQLSSPTRVRMCTLICSTRSYYYTLRMYDSPYTNDTFDYSDLESSIWLA
jgi:hypothetical protein